MDETVPVIHFSMDGKPCLAFPGDTVAAALYRAGRRSWRHFRKGGDRGLLCGMGTCYDCLVTVDGIPDMRACQVRVREGMVIEMGGGEAAG